MRMNVRDFVKIVAEVFDVDKPIVEFGSRQVEEQGEFANLRSFFKLGKDSAYIGCDFVAGAGVDRVEDITNISLENESVGTCLLVETLEHIENPFKAIDEIYRILKPNGMLVLTVPMHFPIHNYPHDYYRYTPEAIRVLTNSFQVKFIASQGPFEIPHTLFCIAFKSISKSAALQNKFNLLKKKMATEMRQYQIGRFGTLISRYYDWKFKLSLNVREWTQRKQIHFHLCE